MRYHYEQHERAAWAVDRARTVMQNMGFSVSIPLDVNENGPDLEAFSGTRKFLVEVKLAHKNKRAWRVNRCTRKSDDIIAIVFPSGYVLFQGMSEHNQLCNASGDRYITALAAFLEHA